MSAETHLEVYRPFLGKLHDDPLRFWPLTTTGLVTALKQRRALFGLRLAVEMDAVGGRDWRRRGAGRGVRFHPFEERDVVIDHVFERGGAVVVEVGSRPTDPPQPGHVELVPVVGRGRAADEAGQQRTPRVGAGAPYRRAARQRDLVGTCVTGQ